MRLQALSEAEVTIDGVTGDRSFFMVDREDAMISATRLGPLLSIVPEVDSERGTLGLSFPGADREDMVGPVELGPPEKVRFFGLNVDARPVEGDFSAAISKHCGVELRLMARPENRPATDRGRSGGLTMIGSGSLRRLEEAAAAGGQAGAIDERRFRMTVRLEGLAPHEEDGWLGHTVRVGGATVEVADMVGRCAATTRDPDAGEVDLKTLHHLRSYRGEVQSTEPLPFGVYARVTGPGMVRLGDPVSPDDPVSSAAPA